MSKTTDPLAEGLASGLASGREKRTNAGSKMSQLLDREEVVDDIYKTIYGGFEDEANDNDYTSEDSDSNDEIDSDFSIDENDEPISDDNEDKERKVRSNVKSVYKDPKRTVRRPPVRTKSEIKDIEVKSEVVESAGSSRGGRRPVGLTDSQSSSSVKRISPKKFFRESTRRNARETEHRLRVARKESERRRLSGRRPDTEYRPLTQSEMLREAKKTEALNIKALERYRLLELEKSKKNKSVKEAPKGSYIRYQSVSMPLIQELDNCPNNETEVSDVMNGTDGTDGQQSEKGQSTSGVTSDDIKSTDGDLKCCRTFISFTDEQTFKEYFPDRKEPQPKQRLVCPISHLPGRYYDPVTLLPYSSAATFRAIREAYYKQLELLGDQRQPEVAKWIQWRKRTSAQRTGIQPRIIRIIK